MHKLDTAPSAGTPGSRRLYLWLLVVFLALFGSLAPRGIHAQTLPEPAQLSVVIELQEPALIEVYTKITNQDLVSSAAVAAATQAQLTQVEAEQQHVLGLLDQLKVPVLYRTQRVYNGIAVHITADQLQQLAQLAPVKALHPLIAKTPANSRGTALIGAPQLWQGVNGTSLTGAGLTIAIIDTGVDYLHTDLGGPGIGYSQNDSTVITDVVGFPNSKVVGGYDFAGKLYNANPEDANFNPTLAPDPDPMDCYPHGTAVAGTAAGYGVNQDGTPYTGPYDENTPLSTLKIGPGVAPAAKLYALKVFGCTGSSEVVDQAIEWAVDPNADGDLQDRVDVINLSLGSDYGSPYDTTTLASERAAALGVIVVAAAGNAGDYHYISSSPANANAALSIAASQPIFQGTQGTEELLYETMAGFSARGPRRLDTALKPDLTAPGYNVVTASQGTGSNPRSVSGTSLATPFVAGSMALLRQYYPTWSALELKALVMNTASTQLRAGVAISTSLYSPTRIGAGRIDLVRALQASAVAYNAVDPGLVSLSFGAPAVETTSHFTKTVAVVNKSAEPLTYTLEYVAITDQLGATLTVPPTVSVAAGQAVTLPVQLTVNPAALQRPRDPTLSTTESGYDRDWLSEESGYLLFWPNPLTLTGALNPTVSPAGLADPTVAPALAGTAVFTYSAASQTLSYTLQLPNVDTSITGIKLIVGSGAARRATYSVARAPSPLANGTVSGAVTLPRASLQLADQPLTVLVTTADQPDGAAQAQVRLATPGLKLPIYAAPQAVSSLQVTPPTLDFGVQLQNTAVLTLTGTALSTIQPLSATTSLLSAALLQTISPRLIITDPLPVVQHVGYADFQYIGVASYSNPAQIGGDPVAGSTVYFAVAMYEPWSSPNEVEVQVRIDVDQDGKDDFSLYNSDQVGYTSKRHSDSFVTALKDLTTGIPSRQAYLNGVAPTRYAPGLYNNRVMLLPVAAAALGLTQQHARFTYQVESYSNDATYYPNGQKRRIDQSAPQQYDLNQPGLRFRLDNQPSSLPYVVASASTIQVDFDLAAYGAAGGQGILLLHHHNRTSNSAEVVPIGYEWATALYLPLVAR